MFSYIREHHMLQPRDKVVLGVSGGADSVCLLFVLLEWAKETPLELCVVHVNHGIRKEAGEDARYVEKLCREQGIPFYLQEGNVPALAEEQKLSQEEAGRKLRYDTFNRVMAEQGMNKLAVAHNANDCAETMLFHLFRGTGIRGLSGIRPTSESGVIRPLLCLERREIEGYLEERGIPYCEDATNAKDEYTRNRIRHHILPYAEQEISKNAVVHMSHTAEMLRQADDYLTGQVNLALARCQVKDTPVRGVDITVLRVESFLQEEPFIQTRLLHSLLLENSPKQKDISGIHVEALQELFRREGNREIMLPQGIRGRRSYDRVELWRQLPEQNEEIKESGEPVRREDDLEQGRKFLFHIFPYEKEMKVPENQYTKWFDYDKIVKSPEIRTRRTGDYLTIRAADGTMVHKKLKDYMITEKIPAHMRDSIQLLALGSHVVWLPGYRISEEFKITENTKRVLQVQLVGGPGPMEEKDGEASCC